MSSGVSPGPGSLKYNSSVQLWQWSVEAVAGSDVATCHSRVCPGPGIKPHEEEAAASVTRLRPACSMVCSCRLQACSGSGHHLECPPAVLHSAPAPQQQRDLATTNSKQQQQQRWRGRVCCQVLVIFPEQDRTYIPDT